MAATANNGGPPSSCPPPAIFGGGPLFSQKEVFFYVYPKCRRQKAGHRFDDRRQHFSQYFVFFRPVDPGQPAAANLQCSRFHHCGQLCGQQCAGRRGLQHFADLSADRLQPGGQCGRKRDRFAVSRRAGGKARAPFGTHRVCHCGHSGHFAHHWRASVQRAYFGGHAHPARGFARFGALSADLLRRADLQCDLQHGGGHFKRSGKFAQIAGISGRRRCDQCGG